MQKNTTSKTGGKIYLVKTNWWNYVKIQIFSAKNTHSLHLNCHSTCPPALEYDSPRDKAVFTSHVGILARAPILREQSDFADVRVPRGQ